MGVTKLMQLMRDVGEPVNIYTICQNKVVGIDAFVWLHTFACVKPEVTLRLVLHNDPFPLFRLLTLRLQNLTSHGVLPIFVFDGRKLPGKIVNIKRQQKIDKALAALQLLRMQHTPADKIEMKLLRECVKIDFDLVQKVIVNVLRPHGVVPIVAPFEADHQLVALQVRGFIDYVITVDSDLLVHSCPKVLYVDDFPTGSALLFADIGQQVKSYLEEHKVGL